MTTMTLRQLAERRPDRLREVLAQRAEQGQAVLPRDLEAMLDAFLRARTVQESAPPQTTEEKLAALRGVVDAGGPQTPVRSLPRWTGPTIGGRSRRQVDDEKVLPLNDTEPLAQHGLLNALIGHGATRSNMPSLEDVGSMSPAMGVMKATQGAARTLTNGMYSRLDEAAKMLPKKGVPASGVMNWLKKSPEGINPEEAAFRKLDQWLSSQGTKTVTPEMLASHLQANPAPFPKVKTLQTQKDNVVQWLERNNEGIPQSPDEWMQLSARLERDAQQSQRGGYNRAANQLFTFAEDAGRHAEGVSTVTGSTAGQPKFSRYQVPGGENYRETLLTLPHQAPEGVPDGFTLKQSSNGQWGVYGPGPMTENRYGSGATPDEALEKFRSLGHTGKPDFRSSHFPDDPNLLLHTRANDRTLPSGEPGRFVEEVQSDWHQQGAKEGYQDPSKKVAWQEAEKAYSAARRLKIDEWDKLRDMADRLGNPNAADAPPELIQQLARWKEASRVVDEADAVYREAGRHLGGVPDAPFKDTWPDLGLKQQLIEAANDPKAEWLGFTGGKTQADRYDLSKHIDALHYAKSGDGYWLAADLKNGGQHAFGNTIPADELADHVGKEMAERIIEGAGTARDAAGGKTLAGLDLQVGGEGMRAFYDQKLPKRLEKIVKPFGGTVEPGKIPTSRVTNPREELIRSLQENDPNGVWSDADNIAEFGAPASDGALEEAARTQGIPGLSHRATEGESMWMSRLTPEMKEAIKRGVPLMTVLAATSGTLANMGQRTTQRGGQ